MSYKKIARFLWKTGLLRWIDIIGSACGLHQRKIISMIDGGLASQMWEFSIGYAAAKKAGLPLYLDLSWFDNSGCDIQGNKNRPFNLFNAFPECKKQYSDYTVTKISAWFMRLFDDRNQPAHAPVVYYPQAFSRQSIYIGRYYTDVRYILPYKKELAQFFKFDCNLSDEEKCIKEKIINKNSIAVHIRRGDYVGSMHEICTANYYKRAIDFMLAKYPDAHFFIFTNGEEWSKQILSHYEPYKYTLLSNRKEQAPIVDMYLMSLCKHAVISNSSFSFMPAFLTYAEEKTVIMPDCWFGGQWQEQSRKSFYMPGWIQMER